MKNNYILLLLLSSFLLGPQAYSQCASSSNIYSFNAGGNTYWVVKENKNWVDAAACAVELGGFLAEIDDQSEQTSIFAQINGNAGITNSNTVAPDGGNASYIWIGGNDLGTEGEWVWNGNNDGSSTQFWQGTSSGSPVGGLYNNWGNEPDNFGGQDGLGLALTDWPLGTAGQWNDVDDGNDLYFLVEFDGLVGVEEVRESQLLFFPNPVTSQLTIVNEYNLPISEIEVFNVMGQSLLKQSGMKHDFVELDLENLESGVYFVKTAFLNRKPVIQKILKD